MSVIRQTDDNVLSDLVATGRDRAATLLQDLGAPQALRLLQSYWPTMASLAVGAALLVFAVRHHALRRTLKSRTPVAQLLPTDTFDPTVEEITRYASTLGRTHRATKVLGTHAAHGVRVRLTTGESGLVEFHVEGSRRMESLLRVAGYGECEHRPVGAPLAQASPAAGGGRPLEVDDDTTDDLETDDLETDDGEPDEALDPPEPMATRGSA